MYGTPMKWKIPGRTKFSVVWWKEKWNRFPQISPSCFVEKKGLLLRLRRTFLWLVACFKLFFGIFCDWLAVLDLFLCFFCDWLSVLDFFFSWFSVIDWLFWIYFCVSSMIGWLFWIYFRAFLWLVGSFGSFLWMNFSPSTLPSAPLSPP